MTSDESARTAFAYHAYECEDMLRLAAHARDWGLPQATQDRLRYKAEKHSDEAFRLAATLAPAGGAQ